MTKPHCSKPSRFLSPPSVVAALGPALFMASGLSAQSTSDGIADGDDDNPDAATVLEQSGNDGAGVFHLNQSAGDGSNQGNVLTIASTADAGAAVADAASSQAVADQDIGSPIAGNASMTEVANRFEGVFGINQSSGAGSSQDNVVALAVTDDPASVAIASATGSVSSRTTYSGAAMVIPAVTIAGFGNDSAGVMQANQIAGIGGRQSNIVSFASAGQGIALADATALDARSSSGEGDGALPPAPAVGATGLSNSFNGAAGLVQVNQATGGWNSQTNLVAAAFGSFADASAISESGLGDVRPLEEGTYEGEPGATGESHGMESSFEGFVGIGQVSQVTGYGNQTANTMSVSVSYGQPGQ